MNKINKPYPNINKAFAVIVFSTAFISSCNPNGNFTDEREAMINVATQFLEVVKSNDTILVKTILLYGIPKNDNVGFAYNVKLTSEALKKYGIPKSEKVSLDSSGHNVPTTIAVIFPIYLATNPNEEFQKAVTKVFVEEISGKYRVLFFDNEYENKMKPIEP